MSEMTKEIAYLVDMLPEKDKILAYEIIKKMVLAWDSDFTKLTDIEREKLIAAEKEIENNEYVNHNDINWN